MKIPIRTQLTAIYCSVFCLSTVLLEIGAYAGLKSSIYTVLDNELQARLQGVIGFLDEHAGRKTLPQLRDEIGTHAALEPEFLEIDRVGGGQIFRGRAMAGFIGGKAFTRSAMISTVNSNLISLRISSQRCTIQNRQYDLHVGVNLAASSEMLRRFRWLVFLSLPVVLACASVAGYWISKRALQPVSRLTNAARRIGAANLSERLSVPKSGDEVQDLAETLNRMLGRIEDAFRHVTQFTANASHELRTPLALIRTTSEVALLRVNGNADSYREALHRILREAEKNSALLDDMLRLARADAAGSPLVLEPIEFGPHIEQLCERVLPLAEEKDIRLEQGCTEGDLWVLADPEQLKRLWLILLDNAIKYTPAGGLITVSWHAASARSLVCEVCDTGIGIAEGDRPHIFERFFRADKARSREEGGAGLGLAIARWIVDAHQGSIDVQSVLGQSSVFRVFLPTVRPNSLQHDFTRSETSVSIDQVTADVSAHHSHSQ